MMNTAMMYFGYIVFIFLSICFLAISILFITLSITQWNMFNPKQKFALMPKRVWNMRNKHYYSGLIWLCWYWDCGEAPSNAKYYRLTDEDEHPMSWHRFTRTFTNTW